jgi:O-antigen ligase
MVPKLTVVSVGAIVLLTLAGFRAVRQGRVTVPAGPLVWIVAAFAAALTLSALTSDNVGLSLVGQHRRYAGLLPYAAYLVIFLVAVRLYATARPRGLVIAFFFALSGVTAYGLVQLAGLDPFGWETGGLRAVFSTMGNTNFAGGYVGMVIPLIAAMVVLPGWERSWRFAGGALLVVSLVYLLGTRASQGPIAAGAGLAVVGAGWLLARRRTGQPYLPPSRNARAATLAAGLVGLAATSALIIRIAPAALNSFSERRYFWGASLRIFADHPVLGVGLDTFRDYFTRYRAPEHAVSIGFEPAESRWR